MLFKYSGKYVNIYFNMKITYLSLENGSFPKTEKEASVKPTLKSGKDQQNVESYRPISNLSFLGKTMEAAAKKQLTAHMETLNVLPGDQSAYREFHSTETALCGIVSDLLEYMDDGKCHFDPFRRERSL